MNYFVILAVALLGCVSGRTLHQDRIIGGEMVTSTSQSPWQVSLQLTGAHICGGTLISTTHVMSAAHCKLSVGSEQTMVALEGLQWNNLAQNMKISEWIRHPDFSRVGIINYDYSVITLASPVTLKAGIVEIIQLPKAGMEFTGTATISGWGLTSASHRIPPTDLYIVDVPIVPDDECEEIFGEGMVTPQTICVGLQGVGACSGDSGGPLWQEVNGVTYLIGNTSWGAANCNADVYPTAYSKNSAVYDWILASMH